ncbi:hypothetical protein AB205_0048630 [Aquarana catesbeiana]|uniref:Uncharacterized protein n=1 Tax=Aquarana catesbeiana TaxID=8400 RepID=A0A2G9Q887_AQUCT|nr:hypothetical protein AB205_0048630 [Aquarana catesbeiana]
MCLELERIANLIQCNVRRGHSAAVYTSGLRSTSVGHKNKLFKVFYTGDVHVVEEQSTHFTSDSAQKLIQDIMFCSQDLDLIKQKTNDIEQKLINVLGRI